MNARAETYKHIRRVNELLLAMCKKLIGRAIMHDDSKLLPPEAEAFENSTKKLAGLTYGTTAYQNALREIEPAVQHHYKHNPHHPEYWADGIRGMSLLDLLEMLCDWKAASERHQDGCVFKSIEQNQARFGYSDELKQILQNTADRCFYNSTNDSHRVVS